MSTLYSRTFFKFLAEDNMSGAGGVFGQDASSGGASYADGDARMPSFLGAKKRNKKRNLKRKNLKNKQKLKKKKKKKKSSKVDMSSSEAFGGGSIHTRFGSTFSGPSFGSSGSSSGFGIF